MVPVSSQPFLALDRNLLAIMKRYSYSSVKKHWFCFWTELWQLPPIWINFTQVSQQFLLCDYLLHIITWVLSDSYHCGGLVLLRLIYKLMDEQPSLQRVCSQGSKTCHVWWQEELHHPPTHPTSKGDIKPRVMVQPCQWQVLWFWPRRAQRHKY